MDGDIDVTDGIGTDDQEEHKDFVKKFVQTSTIHGMRHTSRHTAGVRRFLWRILLLGCCCIFSLQVSLSASHYLSRPVSVDVRINYNDSVIFPAVTICNSNSFRLTNAYTKGYYGIIKSLYGIGKSRMDTKNVQLSNISLEDLYIETGQSKEEFIISCTWDGSECSPDDFTPSLTDFGLCYTFNSGRHGRSPHQAYTTGSGGGLSLQLNIEQYQYMEGPNEGAGLRVHVHSNQDQVLVKDRGLAVPLGAHAFIAAKYIMVNNQKPDYGVCNDSVLLDYFPQYTIENCWTDCLQRYVLGQCGCRNFYMPRNKGDTKVCSLIQYQECLIDAQVKFQNHKTRCECPVPCHQRMYETTISQAVQSNFDQKTLLKMYGNGRWPRLQETYIQAREIRHRVDQSLRNEVLELIENYHLKVTSFTEEVLKFENVLNLVKNEIHDVFLDLFARMEFHYKRILVDIDKNIQYNFILEYDKLKEQSFDSLKDDFSGMAFILNHTLTSGLNKTFKQRMLHYLPIQVMLLNKEEVIKQSENKIQMVSKAYKTSKRWKKFTDMYVSVGRHYDDAMSSSTLFYPGKQLNKALYKSITDGLFEMKYAISLFLQVGDRFLNTDSIDSEKIKTAGDFYISGGNAVTEDLMRYYKEVLTKPRRLVQDRIFELKRYNASVMAAFENINRKFQNIDGIISDSVKPIVRDAMKSGELSQMFKEQEKHNKSLLAMQVSSEKSSTIFSSLKTHMKDLKKVVINIQRDLKSQVFLYENVWKFMKHDPYTYDYYQSIYSDIQAYRNVDEYNEFRLYQKLVTYMSYLVMHKYDAKKLEESAIAGNLTREQLITLNPNHDLYNRWMRQLKQNVNEFFTNTSGQLEVTSHLRDSFIQLEHSYHAYRSHMQHFLQGNQINAEFFQENFMSVDVYMKELRYEEINQQKSYGLIQLLSDVGGSMGLFVGGSVLSLIEVLDISVWYCMYRNKKKQQ